LVIIGLHYVKGKVDIDIQTDKRRWRITPSNYF
jgi:hypothetical protein